MDTIVREVRMATIRQHGRVVAGTALLSRLLNRKLRITTFIAKAQTAKPLTR